jgi:integrase
MLEHKLALTDRLVADLPAPKAGRYLVRDTDLPGFFVQVGKRTKTFMVQGDLRIGGDRQTVRLKINQADRITTRKARASAMEILGKIAKGEDPRDRPGKVQPTASEEPTLREAWVRYRVSHMERKGLSTKTINGYRDHVERLMSDWRDISLAEMANNPKMVVDRHESITKANGPYMANTCMRSLRAIYNHARKSCRSLPPDNPVGALDWNAERRRDTALGLKDLEAWFKQAEKLDHPLRREFHLLLLLSGSRPDALKQARPEHIDFRSRILHIPRPKGGEKKAFDIPLSRAMCRCLIRALRIGRMLFPDQAEHWVFPSESKSGHLVEHKESRKKLAKWGNDLRQTYRTVGQIAGIADLDMHLLMNHSLPGVNAGYITRSKLMTDHLRCQQEKLSNQILACAALKEQAKKWPLLPALRVLELLDEQEIIVPNNVLLAHRLTSKGLPVPQG